MRQDSGIGVLDKAVEVLRAIAESPCGLADLCARTGLPRATAHRLAAGLESHRLLARDNAGRWRLGPALSELSAAVADPLLAEQMDTPSGQHRRPADLRRLRG